MTTLAQPRSRHIPWLFVAGFGVVITVNAVMIWFAVSSFSGLYTVKPRERGLHFNEVVAEQQARDTLGWKVRASWRAADNRLEIMVRDAAGLPLAGAHVTAELVRPVEKRAPIAVAMKAVDLGLHAGTVALPARGNWDVDIVVERGSDHYALTRRMFLK